MKTIVFLFASVLSFNVTQAQNNTVSAGGDASGSNGSVSYSVGQVFYTSAEGDNGSISQGVQQAYDIGVITGVENADIVANLFPNPTVGNVQLNISNFESNAFQMNLFQVAFQFQVERYYNVAMDYDLTGAFQLDSLMNISCNNKCLNLCFDECQQTLICSSLTYSKANKTCKLFNKNVDLANDAVQMSGSVLFVKKNFSSKCK